MKVNIFEGARRIATLLRWGVVAVGVILFFSGEGRRQWPTFETSSPDRDFTFTTTPCSFAIDESRTIDDHRYQQGGSGRIDLCFRSVEADGGGRIMLTDSAGKPGVFTGFPVSSSEVSNYIDKRTASLRLNAAQEIGARPFDHSQWWSERWNWLKTITGICASIVIGSWVAQIAVGWIVRGFTGVAAGEDR